MLECFTKKILKGTELAILVVAILKKAKYQQSTEDSNDEDNGPTEPMSKQPKKVGTIM
jgi:hypothetical protein